MTENEAILYIKKWYQPTTESKEREKSIEALSVVLKCVEEIQKYREIGTVGECREAMSRYRERGKLAKCKECLFLEERKLGKNGAISGICRIKPQNGRRYGTSSACRFF